MEGSECGNMHGKETDKDVPQINALLSDIKQDEDVSSSSDNQPILTIAENLTLNDDDFSWVLRVNMNDYRNCKSNGCFRRFMSFTTDAENTELLINAWRGFRSYLREVYAKSPKKTAGKRDSDVLDQVVKWLKKIDPYQLLLKIEVEVANIVLKVRERILNTIKTDNSKTLSAESFVTVLVEEYVKLLSSALFLMPTIDQLIGSQLNELRITWMILNKHLYLAFIYHHSDIRDMWPAGFKQLKKLLNSKDKLNDDFCYHYVTLHNDMDLADATWREVEPLIRQYRKIKSRQAIAMGQLHTALKFCYSHGKLGFDDDSPTKDSFCSHCQDFKECNQQENGDSSIPTSQSTSRSRSLSPTYKPIDDQDIMPNCKCHDHECPTPPLPFRSTDKTCGSIDYRHCLEKAFEFDPNTETSGIFTSAEEEQLAEKLELAFCDAARLTDESLFNTDCSLLYSALSNNPDLPMQQLTSMVMKVLANGMKHGSKLAQAVMNIMGNSGLDPATVSITVQPEAEFASKKPAEVTTKSVPETPEESQPETKPPEIVKEKPTKHVENETEKKKKKLHKLAADDSMVTTKTKLAAPTKAKPTGSCRKPGVCGHCTKPGNTSNRNAEKHLAAIARLGLSKNPESIQGKSQSKEKSSDESSVKKPVQKDAVSGEADLGDGDDSSIEDTYSVVSNSSCTSASTNAQKDPKHCDCCYCEVFGHGVTVAPVSRNFQEARERLRSRLNMKKKKSAPHQSQSAAPPLPPKPTKPIPGIARLPPDPNDTNLASRPTTKEEDLDSLLQFIEGNGKVDLIDEKKLAKRARQKQKKVEEREEKERQEREAERLRLEALKKSSKKSKKAQRQEAARLLQAATPPPPTKTVTTIAGLKNLVAQPVTGSEPKMVTIRRVMEPFGSEPTVTISIKGSSPDKDEVLFMLDNCNSALTAQPLSVSTEKSKKKKTKNSQKELTVKDIPPVHQKRAMEILKEAQSSKIGRGSPAQRIDVPLAQVQMNGSLPNTSSSSKKLAAKAQSTLATKLGKMVTQSAQSLAATKGAASSLNGVNQNKTNGKIKKGQVLYSQVNEVENTNLRDTHVGQVTLSPAGASPQDRPVYRLSEVLNCIAPTPPPPREDIKLENLRLPPGITITKIEGPKPKTVRACDDAGPITRPSPITPPIVVTPNLKQPGIQPRAVASQATIKPTAAGNVIVVDTGRLKQVITENGLASADSQNKKNKKKKKKKGSPDVVLTPPEPMSQQATIIKTSDNMVTIRSPQLQHAIDMQAANVNRLADNFQGLRLSGDNALNQRMNRLSLAEARATAQDFESKKKRRGFDDDVEQPENVFQPKDIDLEDGDMDDDEREVEAFKRFCLQSVPAARKDKVKVNLNIKDIVVKKKSSAIGCS